LPEESKANPLGEHRVLAFAATAHPVEVKLPAWPKTTSAIVSPAPVSPLPGLSGVSYSSTRLLPESAT
jgi:hypothetical protein